MFRTFRKHQVSRDQRHQCSRGAQSLSVASLCSCIAVFVGMALLFRFLDKEAKEPRSGPMVLQNKSQSYLLNHDFRAHRDSELLSKMVRR